MRVLRQIWLRNLLRSIDSKREGTLAQGSRDDDTVSCWTELRKSPKRIGLDHDNVSEGFPTAQSEHPENTSRIYTHPVEEV